MGGPSNGDIATETAVLREQLLVFQEDFERERQDRAKAQSIIGEYRTKTEALKKRLKHVEQKFTNLEVKVQENKRNTLPL